jgi:transcriptional regulator with GAF, ATPase, and Fis domain
MDIHGMYREVSERLLGTLELGKALENSFLYLREHMPLDEMRVNILDRDMKAVRTIATIDPSGPKVMLDHPLVIPLSNVAFDELAGNTFSDIRIIESLDADRATMEVKKTYFSHIPESSLIIMRLILDGQRCAALLVRALGIGRYGERERDILTELNKPFAMAVQNAIAHHEVERLKERLADDNRFLNKELQEKDIGIVIGEDYGLFQVMQKVRNVAPLNTPVVLLGETGTGKELVAHAIHMASPRRGGPFIKINCGAIPEGLIDSELFGHEKGAFTGAFDRQKGRFERADRGTLFLDEIGELPPQAQVRLLRVLQTGEFERVGGRESLTCDVRIIAATHRDLRSMVRKDIFRKDLWYRLNVFPIEIPPLRERRMDIPALVYHFIEKKTKEMGFQHRPSLMDGALRQLSEYPWPGNVRELENVIERALILAGNGPLNFSELLIHERSASYPTDLLEKDGNKEHGVTVGANKRPEPLDEAIRRHIHSALECTGGKIGGPDGAASLLGINESTLRHRMRKLGIPFGRNTANAQ